MKGTIKYHGSIYVECANCGKEGVITSTKDAQPIPPMRYLERRLRADGWSNTKAHGWTCQGCKGKK